MSASAGDVLRALRAPIAFLAGAGVSIDAPAGLPSARSLMERVLRHKLSAAIEPDDLPHIIDRPTDFPTRPGEYLRFEIAMADVDRNVRASILGALQSGTPNVNHYALAQLIRDGHIVVTTNFDLHIETAYRHLFGRDCKVAQRDADFRTPASKDSGTLWKIHGSLADPESLAATFTSILAQRSERDRWFRKLLENFDLVVLGYSGSDDLDLIPPLAQTVTERHLVWIDHAFSNDVQVIEPQQWMTRTKARMHLDCVGLTRVMFSCDSPTNAVRRKQRAFVLRGMTTPLLRQFANVAVPNDPPPSNASASIGGVGELDPYAAAHNLLALLTFRRGPRVDAMTERARRLLVRAGIDDPSHHLDLLIELYNAEELRAVLASLGKPEWSGIANNERGAFLARLDAMEPSMTAADRVRALRLRACLAGLDDDDRARDYFEASARLARDAGDPFAEFSTLSNYRDYLYPSHFPQFWYGKAPFPHMDRLAELEDQTGFVPMMQQGDLVRGIDYVQKLLVLPLQEVSALSAVPFERVFGKAYGARRYAIDVGDVRGEMEATFIIAELSIAANLNGFDVGGFGWWLEYQRLGVLADALGMRKAFGNRMTELLAFPVPEDEVTREQLVESMFS